MELAPQFVSEFYEQAYNFNNDESSDEFSDILRPYAECIECLIDKSKLDPIISWGLTH